MDFYSFKKKEKDVDLKLVSKPDEKSMSSIMHPYVWKTF